MDDIYWFSGQFHKTSSKHSFPSFTFTFLSKGGFVKPAPDHLIVVVAILAPDEIKFNIGVLPKSTPD